MEVLNGSVFISLLLLEHSNLNMCYWTGVSPLWRHLDLNEKINS